ncbi:hypothetical protein MICRO8M_60161 [Microbacterium sp. 8M]|nr:hypothetical protein MICRO8M_60161 [Microbacterium sp. 8M]
MRERDLRCCMTVPFVSRLQAPAELAGQPTSGRVDAAKGHATGQRKSGFDDVERSLHVKKKTDLRDGAARSHSCTRDRSRCDANVPVMTVRE